MPAIHEFTFKRKVLQFDDTDIVNAVDDKSNIDHKSFMEACRRIVTGKPSEKVFNDSEYEEIVSLSTEEMDKNFHFAMTNLLREVYDL